MLKITKNNILKLCDILIEASFYVLIPAITFSISLVEIASTTMIFAWILKKLLDRDFTGLSTLPFKFLGLYFIWVLLSCINSAYYYESFRGIFKVLEYGFIFIVAATELRKERHLKIGLYILTATSFIICLDGLYQHFSGIDLIRGRLLISEDPLRRISASFVHPNSFGIYLFMVLSVMGGVVVSSGTDIRTRLLLVFPFLISVYCLFLTRSRGAWLSFVASIVIIAFLRSKRAVSIVLILLLVSFVFMPGSIKDALKDSFDISSGTSWERIMLWEGTIDMIKVHPVLGFGINTYSRNFPDYKPEQYSDYRYSHNCYLQMASETGIPGALFFIMFLLSVVYYCLKKIFSMTRGLRKDVSIGLIACLIGFIMGALVDTHFYSLTLAVFFYLFFGFCFAQVSENGSREVADHQKESAQ